MAIAADTHRSLLADRLGGHSLSELERGTIVVIPSLTFPLAELKKIVGISFYEERMMFMSLLLDRPELRIAYLTSVAIDPVVVDYYLSFLADPEGARERLGLFTLDDDDPRPLAEKLLQRPEVVAGVRDFIGGEDGYALTFNVTPLEREIADRMGIPLYGPHPDLTPLGSKSGARRVAREAGVPTLDGAEDLRSIEDVTQALHDLKASRPAAQAAVIKLNDGFSGQGNAVVEYDHFDGTLDGIETVFCAREESWSSFGTKVADQGAVVEEHARHPDLASPSVQMRIGADGSVEVVSTHDQILGDPKGQVYLGCRFPAAAHYRTEIQDYGRRIARVLSDAGVVGSFGIDFVVVPGTTPAIYMTEINLRMGGTSHPFYMARFATGGTYEETTGTLVADGTSKHYLATDNLKSDHYVGLEPDEVVGAARKAGLTFDPSTKTGITFHLLGALAPFGKLGAVSIADSIEIAEENYERLVTLLDEFGE